MAPPFASKAGVGMACNTYLSEDLPSQGHQPGEGGQQRAPTLRYLRGRTPDGPTLFGKLLFFWETPDWHELPTVRFYLFTDCSANQNEIHNETVESKEPPRNRETPENRKPRNGNRETESGK